MHKSWQEQIPFYVAGQLPPHERAALDHHLLSCEDCRETVRLWSSVAQAVREETAARIDRVPPLRVSRNGQYKEPVMLNVEPLRRIKTSRQPVMALVAVLITLLLGSTLLIIAAQPHESDPLHGNRASVAVMLTPTPIPTATPLFPDDTSLPDQFRLQGIRSEVQTWNNSGPATLSMALSYFGWTGDQYEAQRWLRPNVEDKSAAPWQMAYFVENFTDYKALYRMGGTVALLRRLIAAGFPVIVQIGFEPAGEDWMGHHLLLMGYNNSLGEFLAFDSYMGSNEDRGRSEPYAELDDKWRHFNRTFIVVYGPDQEDELLSVLGDYTDPAFAARTALELARVEAMLDREDKWSWFNMGTSYVALGDYESAAAAYDRAFQLTLPWRILWYQFGPYEAYYRVGRYDDVLSLARANLSTTPYVEETYYWQGMAHAGLGQTGQAVIAFDQALQHNLYFSPAEEAKAVHEAGEKPEVTPQN